jgi:sarcosine reductase
VAAGYLPRAQEAIVEMSGPAAALSPLGATHNLVVEFEPAEGAAWEDVDDALRRGVLRLAVRLADAAAGGDAPPDAVEVVTGGTSGRPGNLPRVGVVTNLQTQGRFKDVFVYGRSFAASLPTLIDAGDLDDGAVVSGQFGHPGLKNPTYLHQNHPVVEALRARHGRDLVFAGVVLSPEPVDQAGKELISAHAARLCAGAGFDAAVVTKEGGGNADGDMALKMDALEDLGITAVGVFAEMAGAEGTAPPVVVPPERATAMVSTGNYDERLFLPAVDRALGGPRVDLVDAAATAALDLPTAVVYCSLSPLGWGRLTCREAA